MSHLANALLKSMTILLKRGRFLCVVTRTTILCNKLLQISVRQERLKEHTFMLLH